MKPHTELWAFVEQIADTIGQSEYLRSLNEDAIQDLVKRVGEHYILRKVVPYIEKLVHQLLKYLLESIGGGVSISTPELNKPFKGTSDWDVPVNENIEMAETTLSDIASEAGANVELGYRPPERGTTDWHVPLNKIFVSIEADVRRLANRLDVSDVGGYVRPRRGQTDWHIPLNENFAKIERDLKMLAEAV